MFEKVETAQAEVDEAQAEIKDIFFSEISQEGVEAALATKKLDIVHRVDTPVLRDPRQRS